MAICTKLFTIEITGCAFNECATLDPIFTAYEDFAGIAFAPSKCYTLVIAWNSAFTESYFLKYDLATSSLVLKATYIGLCNAPIWDTENEVFVSSNSVDNIVTFDPDTETISEFPFGLGGGVVVTPMLNVSADEVVYPQQPAVYGIDNGRYPIVIDVAAQTCTRFANPFATLWPIRNMVFSQTENALYGAETFKLQKADITTEVCTSFVCSAAFDVVMDTTRNLLVVLGGTNVVEWDVTTDTQVRNTTGLAEGLYDTPIYLPTLQKVVCLGNSMLGRAVYFYDCNAFTETLVTGLDDYDYQHIYPCKDAGILAHLYNPGGDPGVRKLCVDV